MSSQTNQLGEQVVRVVVVGAGSMGASHARAYHAIDGFELVGIVAPSPRRRSPLAAELGTTEFSTLEEALSAARPHAVCIASYPDTHYEYAKIVLEYGAHLFVEKPLAETVAQAQEIVAIARASGLKVVVGYILRVHPAWTEFTRIARTLGKPLVMRMNLNQQSSGEAWSTQKSLMKSMSPIVDCGVHYVDVMCQMTRSTPVSVQAVGARLSDEIAPQMYNYGHLHVVFEDGSVGWYEAGWGPMMSETAYFVKDVIGPKGSVSIVDPAARTGTRSSELNGHTRTNALLVHRVAAGADAPADELIDMSDEPDHQELCAREQRVFLDAIRGDHDLTEHLADAVNSLRIVLAADESVRAGKTVSL